MKPISVHVSINLENISDKLSENVRNCIQGTKSYEFELPFFIPKVYRKKTDELPVTEQAKEDLIEKLIEWLEYCFPATMKEGTSARIITHCVTYVQYCCPHFSLDCPEFELIVKATAIPLLVDFVSDCSDELFMFNINPDTDVQDGIDVVDTMIEETKDLTTLTQEIKLKLFKLEKVHKSRFTSMLGGTMYDMLVNDLENNKNLQENRLISKIMLSHISAALILKKGNLDGLSINTHRYLRALDGSASPLIALAVTAKKTQIGKKVTENPLMARFLALVDEITTALNDILGLQKDVRNGEDNGMVFYHFKFGTDVKTSLDKEILILKENVQDYMFLRECLLGKFPKEENLEEYLEITDSMIFGLFQVFSESKVYGMRNQIVVNSSVEE